MHIMPYRTVKNYFTYPSTCRRVCAAVAPTLSENQVSFQPLAKYPKALMIQAPVSHQELRLRVSSSRRCYIFLSRSIYYTHCWCCSDGDESLDVRLQLAHLCKSEKVLLLQASVEWSKELPPLRGGGLWNMTSS